MLQHALLALLASFGLAAPAAAHDFWMQPSSFRPAVGARVDVSLLMGERLAGEPVARREERVLRFVAVDPAGAAVALPGVENRAPAGLWRPAAPGLHVLGFHGAFSKIELEAAPFEAYLREEGLEHVIAARAERGESARPGREAYARCAKAYAVAAPEKPAGAGPDLRGWDRALGFPLEIVPLANPLELAPGAKLPVRVLRRGEPLSGARIGLLPQAEPAREVRLRTDENGRAEFEPAFGGLHLLRVVWMDRAAAGAGHDWESWWATLTFELPAR
jgi:hypothetical protein